MAWRANVAGGLAVLVGVLWASVAKAEDKPERWTSSTLPLEQIPSAVRNQVRQVVEHPTVYAHGVTEEFPCRPAIYFWLLEHPDRAIAGWRLLGARCVDITDQGGGRFSWTDGAGSEIHWDTVYHSDGLRIWYAEGNVRPGPALPKVSVEALLVLRHVESRGADGKPVLVHQADLMLHTDGKAVTVVAKVLGGSSQHFAEHYLAQLEQFYSVLACYLDQHPDKLRQVLAEHEPAQTGKAP